MLGAVITFRGMSYKTTKEVAKVGDVAITDTDKHGIPHWSASWASWAASR